MAIFFFFLENAEMSYFEFLICINSSLSLDVNIAKMKHYWFERFQHSLGY